MNEAEKFFKGLKGEDNTKADIFGENTTGQVEKKEEGESGEDKPKNRHSRRWEAKYQAERESSIELAARLSEKEAQIKQLTEAQKYRQEIGSDVSDEGLKSWLEIYGDRPEHRKAYEILQNKIIKPVSDRAERLQEELDEVKNRDVVANQQVKEYEGFIDREFERLEDRYDVDFTSDEALRNALLDEVKRISPKDTEGNIKEYGDFDAAMENVIEKSKQQDAGSQKRNEIASRSMANNGGNTNLPPQRSRGWDGWKKDLRV